MTQLGHVAGPVAFVFRRIPYVYIQMCSFPWVGPGAFILLWNDTDFVLVAFHSGGHPLVSCISL